MAMTAKTTNFRMRHFGMPAACSAVISLNRWNMATVNMAEMSVRMPLVRSKNGGAAISVVFPHDAQQTSVVTGKANEIFDFAKGIDDHKQPEQAAKTDQKNLSELPQKVAIEDEHLKCWHSVASKILSDLCPQSELASAGMNDRGNAKFGSRSTSAA